MIFDYARGLKARGIVLERRQREPMTKATPNAFPGLEPGLHASAWLEGLILRLKRRPLRGAPSCRSSLPSRREFCPVAVKGGVQGAVRLRHQLLAL